MAIQTLNPYTNEVEVGFDPLSSDKLYRVISDAEMANMSWKDTSVSYRAVLLKSYRVF